MSDPKLSIYVVGDSISIQYGPFIERALGDAVGYGRKEGEAEALLNLDEPQGANGGNSGQVRRFLEGLVNRRGFHKNLMLINCGLHDIKTDPATGAIAVEPDAYRDNLNAIVDLAGSLADGMAWVRTTAVEDELHAKRGAGFNRIDADVDRYNAIADAVMADRGVPVIDLHGFSRRLGVGGEVSRDGVHFHEPVRRQQGAFIAGWVLGRLG